MGPAYFHRKGITMSEGVSAPGESAVFHGWRVVFAGLGINLALGILYTWSVISKGMPEEWGWTEADKSWPYSVACLVFCFTMVAAGRMQDKIGPRIVASIGGVLVGIGFIVASIFASHAGDLSKPVMLAGFILGFGVLAGAGFGFGYASATPPAVKWFASAKTGLIAGIVVSGFGLASVYAAPLAKWLMTAYSFQTMLITLAIAFLVVVVGLAQILRPPAKGYVPAGSVQVSEAAAAGIKEEFLPREMLGTVQFYMLWFMYACGAGAGLMIISKLAAIGKIQVGIELGFVLVAVLAIGNGSGRVIAGVLSDKIGRKATMFGSFVLQAALIFILSKATEENILGTVPVMILISMLTGANYGANLSLFPSITKDFYGAKNFGMNYGLVFTAWGVGGFMLSKLAGSMYDKYETFDVAYYGASALLILAAVMVFFVKPPHHKIEAVSSGEGES